MKYLRTIFVTIAFFLAVPMALEAQDTSTQGTEFWVSFMSNGHKYHPDAPNDGNWVLTQLLISSQHNCNGTINNPQTGWSRTFTVQANNITTVEIPESQAYIDDQSEQVLSKGLQITTDSVVSVFCTNIAHLSFDASYVLPVQSLASDYIVQTYNQSHSAGSSNPYQRIHETSAFLIVATEDNTTIDITPTALTLGNHAANQTFSITMDKGQAYQVRSNNSVNERDLSGSTITAHDGKPIAVFNGNTLTAIPTNASSYDHIFEQAMPIQSWGKKFVVTGSLERERDWVKVTSVENGNQVLKNGELIATLNQNESHIFELTSNEKSCFIETSGPAAVYLYNNTRGGNSIGDPSVVWIAPIEQRIDDITFTTFNNEHINIDTHHVNIIVDRNDIGTVSLDGNLLPASAFENVAGSNEYSFTRQDIPHGVHHLECQHGFNAHVYGFGTAKGYAYLVGSKTIDLSTQVTINETTVPKQGTYEYCPDEAITFAADVNYENYELTWEFGDGATSTQNPATHTYAEKRVYEVTLTVIANGRAQDISRYYVDTHTHTITENAEICSGSTYTGHGLNVTIYNDTIIGLEIDNDQHPVCKDSLLIYFTALPAIYATYNDTRCWFGEPETYNAHGFNFVYDHPGEYNEQVTHANPEGCDSIIDLHLVVADRIVNPNPVEYIGCEASFTWNDVTYTESGDYEQVLVSDMGCDSIIQLHIVLDEAVEGGTDTIVGMCTAYEWHGHFYDQPGFYTDTIPNSIGCDSIVHLQLTMSLTPDPSEIQPMDTLTANPHMVISATEFDIHAYDFTLYDSNPGMVWDSVVWSFATDNNEWELRPFGEGDRCCNVVVTNRVEDTVWLVAKVYDPCHPGESIERRYWLLCTFYGVDENDVAAFDIIPNPNQGAMTIITQGGKGDAEVKVYNMTGVLVDQFVLNTDSQGRYAYNLGGYPSGIYLMVFHQQGKNTTKKFVITK